MSAGTVGTPAGAAGSPSGDELRIDPDWVLADLFLAGEMTEDEFQAMLRRMEREPELWLKIGPVISAFIMARGPALDAGFASVSPEMVARFARPLPPRRSHGGASTAGNPPVDPPPSIEGAAEGTASGAGTAEDRTTSRKESKEWDRPRGGIRVWTKRIFLTVLGLLVLMDLYNHYNTTLFSREPTLTVLSPKRQTLDRQLADRSARGFNIVPDWGTLAVDSTGPGQFRWIREPSNVLVEVRPDSRYSFRSSETVLGFVFSGGSFHGTVDGEALLWVGGKSLTIDTNGWTIELETGLYAIRSVPHSGRTLLSVGSGAATIRERTNGPSHGVVAMRGTYVTLPDVGALQRTQDSTGFPSVVRTPKLPLEHVAGGPARMPRFQWR